MKSKSTSIEAKFTDNREAKRNGFVYVMEHGFVYVMEHGSSFTSRTELAPRGFRINWWVSHQDGALFVNTPFFTCFDRPQKHKAASWAARPASSS